MQWFENVDGQTLYMDEIDSALKFIGLGWQRTSGIVGQLSSALENCPVPARYITGLVHLLKRN